MDQNAIVLIVAIALALAVAGWFVWRQQRSSRLRRRFGREYHHEVERAGSTSRAEATLEAREKRVARLHITPLLAGEAARFADAWDVIQTQFVDAPHAATLFGLPPETDLRSPQWLAGHSCCSSMAMDSPRE